MALDLLIRSGTVIDGTGAPPGAPMSASRTGASSRSAHVTGEAETTLDASGLTVTPGFIDIHSHSDYTLLVDPRAVSALTQGVTWK